MSRAYVYAVPESELPPYTIDGLEVLVRVNDAGEPTEVCIRPTAAGDPIRIWSAPLELVRAER